MVQVRFVLVVALSTACLPLDEVNRSEYEDLVQRIEALENGTTSSSTTTSSDTIADRSVTTDKLANDAVTAAKLAPNSVDSEHVVDGSLTSADLGVNACSTSEIADDAVTSSKIADNAVTSAAISNGSVTGTDIADSTINGSDIADNSLTSSDIGVSAVDDSELSDYIGFGTADVANGAWFVYSADGANEGIVGALTTDGDVGYLATQYTGTGNAAAVLTTSSASNGGYVGVSNDADCCDAGMYVDTSGNGIVWGDTKSFVIDHPLEPELRIVYASLEGPEAAAYVRGTAQLVDGFALVELPEHFRWVVGPEGLTAQVTATSAQSPGLAVTDLTPEFFIVEELGGGTGSYSFYWTVQGVRRGHETFATIRPASDFAPTPVTR